MGLKNTEKMKQGFAEQHTENPNTTDVANAINQGNIASLIHIGFERFMALIFNHPISAHSFLKYTGEFLDNSILDICKNEHLQFVGGKLIMQIAENNTVSLSANMYFKDCNDRWILKTREGNIPINRINDWENASEIEALRRNRTMELSIDPPDEE